MMNDMLSQEEIDALLKGSPSEDSYDADDILSDMEKDAIGEIGNISMGTAATTLFTLLGQRVNITTPTVDLVTLNELSAQYPLPFVAVQVGYKEGITGTNLLVLKDEDVKIITSLMMGGDGISNLPDSLDEIHLSAIGEAMNQMMGSSSTALSEMIFKKIDILPPKVFKFDMGDENLDLEFIKRDEQVVKVSFRMTIGELIDSNIMQILPIDFAKSLVDNMLYGAAEVSSQSTPSVPPNNEPPKSSYEQPQQPVYQNEEPVYTSNANYVKREEPRPQQQVNVQSVKFESFDTPSVSQQHMPENIEIIKDVLLKVTVELGRTKKTIDDILEFGPGTILELDRLVGEPLDILINGKNIAKGEVVVIDENYGIRITDIVKPDKRLRSI